MRKQQSQRILGTVVARAKVLSSPASTTKTGKTRCSAWNPLPLRGGATSLKTFLSSPHMNDKIVFSSLKSSIIIP